MPTHEVGTPAAQDDEDPATPLEILLQRIQERTATVGVIGLGYVGLPLALACADVFQRAIGFDVNLERIAEVNKDSRRAEASSRGTRAILRYCATVTSSSSAYRRRSRRARIPTSRTFETPQTASPRTFAPGQIVILESTTYPGTTEEMLLPHFEANGMVLDRDFYLAFSPERVDPGQHLSDAQNPARSSAAARPIRRWLHTSSMPALVDVVHTVSNARAAETVKLLENTFRLVNIGLINEFAVLCNHLGIDSNEVITAAATKPFGFLPFFPGPGAGGHCIPLDPLYLNWKAKQQGVVSRFIELADDINTKMPAYVVEPRREGAQRRFKIRARCAHSRRRCRVQG